MASVGISESTFAVCFLAEQMNRNWDDLATFPILPSLVAEGSVGWDANLITFGSVFFYQFKISDYMWHWKSAHYSFLSQQSYYRFHLHRYNDYQQHASLRELAKSYPDTYYVAPEVYEVDAYYSAYTNGVLTEASRFVPLVDCYDITDVDSSHEIFYRSGVAGDEGAWQASEPAKVRTHRGASFGDMLRHSRSRWKPFNQELASDLVEDLSRVAHQSPRINRTIQSDPNRLRATLRQAADLAAQLGVHLVLAGERMIPPSEQPL